MRRTQQAVSTVLPSVGVTYGLRKVASRVSPSGNSLTGPSVSQERYPFPRPRVTEDRTNPTIGTARAAAPTPLNRIPSFMNNPRRVTVFSCDIVSLLALCGIRNWIRLPGILHALRLQPRNDVPDFLPGHRLARDIPAPVW